MKYVYIKSQSIIRGTKLLTYKIFQPSIGTIQLKVLLSTITAGLQDETKRKMIKLLLVINITQHWTCNYSQRTSL